MNAKISPAEVGARLLTLRNSKGEIEQQEWADMLGVSPPRYNNWERGRQVIPVENATRVCELTGATLDYIYLGDISALPRHLLVLEEKKQS